MDKAGPPLFLAAEKRENMFPYFIVLYCYSTLVSNVEWEH